MRNKAIFSPSTRSAGLPKAEAGLFIECGQDRQNKYKVNPTVPQPNILATNRIRRNQTFDPDQRCQVGREEPQHRVVIGGGDAVNQRRAGQPAFALVDAILQQASDDVGKQKQVEHFPGRRGSVFPETQLQAQSARRTAAAPSCRLRCCQIERESTLRCRLSFDHGAATGHSRVPRCSPR